MIQLGYISQIDLITIPVNQQVLYNNSIKYKQVVFTHKAWTNTTICQYPSSYSIAVWEYSLFILLSYSYHLILLLNLAISPSTILPFSALSHLYFFHFYVQLKTPSIFYYDPPVQVLIQSVYLHFSKQVLAHRVAELSRSNQSELAVKCYDKLLAIFVYLYCQNLWCRR